MAVKEINALVLRTAGTNCDEETVFAFRRADAKVSLIHINQLRKAPEMLSSADIFCIPGGFSYGDDISAGKVLSLEITLFLKSALEEFIAKKGLIIGICNGFQVLVKTGLLPASEKLFSVEASLVENDSGMFIDKWVELEVVNKDTPWTRFLKETVIKMPIAHAEGKFVARQNTIERLVANNQVVFKYAHGCNPNGSLCDIAGICDPSGQILGMMPHPERAIVASQYPDWQSRLPFDQPMPPLEIFHSAVSWARENR